jgi:hypothetical protein
MKHGTYRKSEIPDVFGRSRPAAKEKETGVVNEPGAGNSGAHMGWIQE